MNRADKEFYDVLNEIINEGTSTEGQEVRPHWADGTPAHTIYLNQFSVKYKAGEVPLTSLRPIAVKSAIKELLWIYQDQSNDLDLLKNKYNVTWWDDWEVDGSRTIGQRYGATVKKYDLMNKLLKELKEQPYGRRHIMSMWQEEDFKTPGLMPCAFMTEWNVRGEYLDMTLIQRSGDSLVAAAPGGINEFQYYCLLLMVAKSTGFKPGNFMHYVGNIHIYDRHMDQAKEIVSRYELMTKCRDEACDTDSSFCKMYNPVEVYLETEETDFYKFKWNDFRIKNYKPMDKLPTLELAI